MAASLCLLHAQITEKPLGFKELVPSFVSILKQIVEHRLPRDFDYHRMPAPWVQIRLLAILRTLCAADQAASEQTYEILIEVRGNVWVFYGVLYGAHRVLQRLG